MTNTSSPQTTGVTLFWDQKCAVWRAGLGPDAGAPPPANERTAEMEKALRLIMEHRGVCGACGADCDGPGKG